MNGFNPFGSWEQLIASSLKNIDNKKNNMNGDKAIKDFIKKYVVYALDADTFASTDGTIDEGSMEKLLMILRKSKFNIKRKKLRGVAVEDGLSAIAFSIVKGKVFFDVYRVYTPFTEVADKLTKVYLYQDFQDVKDKGGSKIKRTYYKFETIEGKTIKQQYEGYVGGTEESFELASPLQVESDFMPVIILPNNEDYQSTFEFSEKIIEAAGRHLNNIDTEWQYDKSMLVNNNIMNPIYNGKKVQSQIEDGKDTVFDLKDPNGRFSGALSFLSGGGVSSQVAQRNYDKFKAEGLFFSLSYLIVSDGKTNKHGAEVITSQLPSLNSIQFQIELLNEFYSHFIYTFIKMLNRTGEIDFDIEELPTIKVSLSPFMETLMTLAEPKPSGVPK